MASSSEGMPGLGFMEVPSGKTLTSRGRPNSPRITCTTSCTVPAGIKYLVKTAGAMILPLVQHSCNPLPPLIDSAGARGKQGTPSGLIFFIPTYYWLLCDSESEFHPPPGLLYVLQPPAPKRKSATRPLRTVESQTTSESSPCRAPSRAGAAASPG